MTLPEIVDAYGDACEAHGRAKALHGRSAGETVAARAWRVARRARLLAEIDRTKRTPGQERDPDQGPEVGAKRPIKHQKSTEG